MADRGMMGGLASMGDYAPGDFPDTLADRFPQDNWTYTPPMDANEAAAYRLARPYARANAARMSEDHPVAALAEGLAPKEPWQYGLMLAGPGAGLVGHGIRLIPPTARMLGAAGAFALGLPGVSDKAEGGLLDKAGKVLLAGKPGGPHPGGIHVYHSSPHDFDKFDWSKLRTGEGANMYGSGFYFAENPAVSGQGGQYWNQFSKRFAGDESTASTYLQAGKFDRERAAENLHRSIYDTKQAITNGKHSNGQVMSPEYITDQIEYLNQQRRALKLLESGAPVGPRTYEVNINARPELMLDWDKPLAQMSPEVQTRLKDAWLAHPEGHSKQSGAQIYDAAGMQSGMSGVDAELYASQKLREAGIPGIRYLDQGSRPAANLQAQLVKDLATYERLGNKTAVESIKQQLANPPPPTYNYVVTDPSRLDILAKYGVVGTAGGGMGVLAAQDNYQSRAD